MGLVKLGQSWLSIKTTCSFSKNDDNPHRQKRHIVWRKTTAILTNRNDSNFDQQKRHVVFSPTKTTCRFWSSLTSSRINPIQLVPDCRPDHISSSRAPFHVIQRGFCLFFYFLMIYGINSLKQAQLLLQQIKSKFEQNPKIIRDKPRVILTISSQHK